MSWESQMVEMVRVLVDDMSTTPTYTDKRLQRVLIVSAYQILQETRFETTYVVNILEESITPDPTDGVQDFNFINLWALKSACIIYGSEFKTQSMNAISVKNGPTSIDLRDRAASIKFLYDKFCKDYENYKLNYIAGTAGKAILTPFSPGSDSIQANGYQYGRGGYFSDNY